MTGHCAPACHCATSSATIVPVMYTPWTVSTSNARSDGGGASSSTVAAPLLVPKPKSKPDAASLNTGVWLVVGLAGLVVLAFILVIIFSSSR